MRLVVFASGSGGNCALLSDGDTHLLIDAGISLKRIREALGTQRLSLSDLTGILITHEHSDHVAALPMLLKYTALPFFAPRTVGHALCRTLTDFEPRWQPIAPLEPFSVGTLLVTAFPTPHDTDESVGYRFEKCGVSFAFCTDTGCVTETMLSHLLGCRSVVIEANHDSEMLLSGPYPIPLKRRILSEHGHLSNADCASLACRLAENGTEAVVLAHLSRENNRPAKAFDAVRSALDQAGHTRVALYVAPVLGALALEL